MRLAILTSHPIQYYVPLFRRLGSDLDLHVFYCHKATAAEQAAAGFGIPFDWDIDLTSGYNHSFLKNVALTPSTSHFFGCDTPEIAHRLKVGRFDAVLAMGWHLKSMLQGIWAAKRIGLPVLVRGDSQLTTQRSVTKRYIKSLAYPVLLRVFDRILFVGVRNKAYYEHYNYPTVRLHYSPHCVETVRFSSAAGREAREAIRERIGVGPDVRVLLFAGKLIPFKRPVDTIDSAMLLRARGIDAQVMVAGSGELEGEMRRRARECGVPLHLLGFQNQSQMPAVYAAADALVLPSTGRETWGLVCNEALACATPIVVSDAVGCAPDLAGDGKVGRQYPLGDTQACARELFDLFAAPPSQGAISDVSRRFTISVAARGITDALSSINAERGK